MDAPEIPAERLNPVTFAIGVLLMKLYGWQAAILHSVWSGRPTVARTPNGAGKTSVVIAALALCTLHEYPGATVVVTTATFRQVKVQVFAALEQHKARFSGWSWNDTAITTPQGGMILGFATDSGGKFEGFHAYPGRPLMIIVDEAKTVADDIFVAIDRCKPTFLLLISSPGGLLGRFHDAFKKARYAKFAVSAKDCPHFTPQFMAEMREEYGEDSDIYRSMVDGEFGSGENDGRVIPFHAWEKCVAQTVAHKPGRKVVFCDFAESSDENVIAARDGNKVVIDDAWVGNGDTDAITMRFFRRLKVLQSEGYAIYGDADGTGHGYITALRLMGIKIQGVHNNAEPADPHYFNLAAEMWWKLAKKISDCAWILPAHDEISKKQLLNREEVYREVDGKKVYGREDGRLQLMPKSRLNTKSPDRADAIVGASYDYPSLIPIKGMGTETTNAEDLLAQLRGDESHALAGCDCG